MKIAVKRALKWLTISLCVGVLVCAVLLVLIHTGPGRSATADFLSAVLSRGEGSVKITGLDFLFPKRLGFEKLIVCDGKGQWLAVDDAFLKWDPWSVVRGRIHVLEVGAGSIDISRFPKSASGASKGKKKASGDAAVPWDLLARVSISSASFESVSIDESVAGAAMSFRLGSAFSPMARGEEAVFSLDVERLDGPGGHARISASVNASERRLAVDGHISDPEGGVVSTLMGKAVPVEVSISGGGPFSMWTGSVNGTAGDLGALSLDLTLKDQGTAFRFTGDGEIVVLSGITGRPAPDSIELAFDAELSRDRKINVRDFRLIHPGAKFISTGTFDGKAGTIAGSFSLGVPDAGAFFYRETSRVNGGFEIAGELNGSVIRPVLDTEVIGTGICTYDFSADRVTGKIRAVLDREGEGWGTLDVKAEAAGSGVVFPGGVSIPGDDVTVEADMRVTADGAVSGQGNAALGTGLSTSFSGSLSSSRAVEVTGRIESNDLSALSGIAGVPLAGASKLEFSMAGPTAESFTVNLEGTAEPALLTRLTGRSWPGGNLSLKGSLKLDEGRKLQLTDLVLADDAFRLSAVASMVFSDQSFFGEIDLKIPELALFSSVAGIPLSGLASFRADLEGKSERVSAEAEGDFSNVSVDGFRFDQGKIGLNAQGRLSDIEGDLAVEVVSGDNGFHLSTGIRNNLQRIDLVGISIKGPGSTVEGNMGFSHETKFITGNLKYHIEDPGHFLKTFSNGQGTGKIRFFDDGKEQKAFVEFTGSQVETAYGSIGRIRAEGEAAGLFPPRRAAVTCLLSDLKTGDFLVSSATVEGELSDLRLSVDLDMKGDFHSGFSSGLSASISDGPERIIAVSRFDHVHGGIPVRLNSPVRVVLAGRKVSMEEASFSIGKGTLGGSGVFDRDASIFSVEASYHKLPLALVSALGYEAGDGLVSGSMNISNGNKTPVLKLDALVEGFGFPGLREDAFPALDADLRVESNGNRIEGSGEIRGAGKTPLTVKVAFPVEYRSSSALPRFMPAGEIEGRLAWDFDLKDVQDMGVRMSGDLSGKAGLKIHIQGTAENPEVKCEFHVANGGYRDPQAGSSIENLGVNLSAHTLPAGLSERLALTGSISGISSSPFEISGELPFVFSLSPFRFTLPGDGEVEGFLRGDMDLAAVPAAFSLDRHHMQGLMKFDLDLAGTVFEPRLSGSAQLNQGYFEDITTGTVLEEISLHLEASPPRVKIARCEARAGQDGKVRVEGWLEAAPGETASYDVTLKMENAALLRRDDAYAVMGGSIRLRGTGLEALVTGKVLLERVEIMIPDHVANDIPQLEVVEIHGDRKVEAPVPSTEQSRSLPVDIDVRLESPGRLFVAGRGLDSEWKGTVHVKKGKGPEMEVSGGFSLVRGYFNLLGKRFTLTRGKIQLGGPSGTSPLIDVEGRASSGGMTAEVKVSGPATSPSISLSSSPAYPSDEILARLLFGRSADTLTPLQALQLAQAVRTLAGGGGLDVFSKTRKLLGIDQLELMQSDEDEAAIRAGKYIHDRIYFQVEQGVGSSNSKASVEVELSPNLSLETGIGADSGGGVGVKWRWDY
ncbi:MAG: translocation/assembly module TamB domain-containing protein [Desulfatiglandaceae bacterium]